VPTITAEELLASEAVRFAKLLHAYRECSLEIRQIVDEMAEIIVSPDSSNEERDHATDALLEALLPGLCADVREHYESVMRSPSALKMREELDQEESTFAEKLHHCMKQKRMTQSQLAEKVGIRQSAVSNILRRKCRPQRRTVARFAEALGLSPEELWPTD